LFQSEPYEDNRDSILSAGESPADYQENQALGLPANWFSDPWRVKRKERGKVESIVAAQRIQPWDKASLSIMCITEILQTLRTDSARWKGVLALALLAGIAEQEMKGLKIEVMRDEYPPEVNATKSMLRGKIFFDPIRKALWWLNEMGTNNGQKYLSLPLVVYLDLPEIITRHLPTELLQDQKVFSDKDMRITKHFLQNFGRDGVRSVTMRRLNNTFEAFFINGAGLPILFADIFHERPKFHLASQHFYVTLPWSYLVGEWHRMIGKFMDGACSGESSSMISQKMLYKAPTSLNFIASSYAGANRTPRVGSLRNHFAALKQNFPSTSERLLQADAKHWNAYMAYIYNMYAACTGHRPLRDPMPLMRHIDFDLGIVFIDDKHNRKFKESRSVKLCPTLKKSFLMHRDIHSKWISTQMLKGFSMQGPSDSFFLIDESSKALVSVSPKECDRLLDCNVIGEGYFENLENSLRHFLLTRLHYVGVPQLVIDFISGHRHMGMEPEFIGSPFSWELASAYLVDVIEEEVIKALGLEVPFEK